MAIRFISTRKNIQTNDFANDNDFAFTLWLKLLLVENDMALFHCEV